MLNFSVSMLCGDIVGDVYISCLCGCLVVGDHVRVLLSFGWLECTYMSECCTF